MAVQRMDNVGIVVDDLKATIAFFLELGLELEGQAIVEGEWAGRVTGLGDQRVEVAMMRTPDGHSPAERQAFHFSFERPAHGLWPRAIEATFSSSRPEQPSGS